MRILEMVEQIQRQAETRGGMTFLAPIPPTPQPTPSLPADADPRWRPAPNADGSLFQDPDFTLPTVAGPLNFGLFYDGNSVSQDSEWGFGRRGSFPLRLVQTGTTVTVMHEDGTLRQYSGSANNYTPVGAL